MKTTKLIPTGVYKDGGSISYVDEKTTIKYWRNLSFRDRKEKKLN